MSHEDSRRPPAPVAVRVGDWGWRYAGRHAWAVRGLTLSVEPGERVLLLGASGAGKSTVLAGLAGVLGGDDDGETQGSLLLDGRAPTEVRGRSGLLLQDPDAQVILARVGDDVAFACENLGVARDELWPRVRAALDAVALDVPLDRSTAQLSGGQKQRLALAGLLAMRPGLLLLDEPTANLDPQGAAEVRDAVASVLDASGATMIVVEHRVAVWRDVVDRVVVLDAAGGVLADGAPDDVLADAAGDLRRAGVWLPGAPTPVAPAVALGGPLLEARELAVGHSPLFSGRRRAGGGRRRHRGDGNAGDALPFLADLAVAEGSAVALTGRSGAGKSTLALTLGGLLPRLGGTLAASPALANGAGADPGDWRSRELLTRIGSVFQSPEHQFLASRVRDELAAGPRALRLTPAETDRRVSALLDALGLSDLADANPFTLSGGQKRRLSVGTALATRPGMLVLDEPTFGQDANTWRALVELIAALRGEGHAIVAATHDAEFASAIGASELRVDARREVAA
ncbi:ABC transporter ATP-binding protein [uncultured Leifsonia sp.]|uniref:ABC transporter ATP-binding protein n=1 Tax=uncultured Leifsonia sp. TaxID=340359 RepID=UPI0025F7B0D1|nr:ABC transporter ATP-binding protein [uncultured Leifsonia sp.]